MPSRKLPPLIALRVFECAARHESFTRAAEELCVTQAAVSHQIKALEEWLGVLLFKRLNRSIKLTPAGTELAPQLTQALDLMADGTAKVLQGEIGRVIRVATLDSFVAGWVIPRLASFYRQSPELGLRFLSKRQEEDALASGEADVEIRYGDGGWTGVVAVEFMREDIFPVVSPRLLAGGERLRSLHDLRGFDLLHDVLSIDWKAFLEEFDIDDITAERGIGFTESHLVMQACIAGHGVALGRGALVESALQRGDLVRPLDASLPAEFSYHLVFQKSQREDANIRVFADWLSRENEHRVELVIPSCADADARVDLGPSCLASRRRPSPT